MPVTRGVQFTFLIGASVPVPVPVAISRAFVAAEITESDEGHSGFQLTFRVGREDASDLRDYDLIKEKLLKPFSRVILVALINTTRQVVIDGIITHHQFMPSNQPGSSRLMVTGEDISVMMDLEEKIVAHPAQADRGVALRIIAGYAQYGIRPEAARAKDDLPALATERVPVQHGTDLSHLQHLAKRRGYVFYVEPGALPGASTAYWGPPDRKGKPQPALSFDMGASTTLEDIRFEYNALAASTTSGYLQDSKTAKTSTIRAPRSMRRPALAKRPALKAQSQVRQALPTPIAGLTSAQARAIAQGLTDRSTDQVVTAEGELSVSRYGQLLRARHLVGLRGCGDSYDGLYYVKKVTHLIRLGKYRQQFTLTREGLGSTLPTLTI